MIISLTLSAIEQEPGGIDRVQAPVTVFRRCLLRNIGLLGVLKAVVDTASSAGRSGFRSGL